MFNAQVSQCLEVWNWRLIRTVSVHFNKMKGILH